MTETHPAIQLTDQVTIQVLMLTKDLRIVQLSLGNGTSPWLWPPLSAIDDRDAGIGLQQIHGISRLPSLFLFAENKALRTDGRTDGRTHALIESWLTPKKYCVGISNMPKLRK